MLFLGIVKAALVEFLLKDIRLVAEDAFGNLDVSGGFCAVTRFIEARSGSIVPGWGIAWSRGIEKPFLKLRIIIPT